MCIYIYIYVAHLYYSGYINTHARATNVARHSYMPIRVIHHVTI